MALQTGRSHNSYSIDVSTRLEDGAAAITSAGAGSDVLDFGNITSGPAVEQVARTKGSLIIDVSAFDFTTGDETAVIIYQLSDNASGAGTGFDASDTIVNKVAVPFGAAGGIASSAADDDSALGRSVVDVDNEHKGTIYRFARVFVVPGGTTPSITFTAFLGEALK